MRNSLRSAVEYLSPRGWACCLNSQAFRLHGFIKLLMWHRVHEAACRLTTTVFIAALLVISTGCASAGNGVAFWLAPRSNTIVDTQVAELIGRQAGVVVLRASRYAEQGPYNYDALLERLNRSAGEAPVLAYAVVTRIKDKGRIEEDMLKDVRINKFAALAKRSEKGEVKYPDLTDSVLQRDIVAGLVRQRRAVGADGIMLDLSMRTPSVRPKALAQKCRVSTYCEKYAQAMDVIFEELRSSTQGGGYVAYNGLWNSEPGILDDQIELIKHADAVAIEYFGADPNISSHRFNQDVLPYLWAMARIPKDKKVMVFGRGDWDYVDYLEDYRWQRYLFASFLLAKRGNDLFKYHASFQVPAHKGRSGGLDVYADWRVKLGHPVEEFSVDSGLYRRSFSRGLVIVAPDDGNGGKVFIPKKMYTPEGEIVRGLITLSPGDAFILVDGARRDFEKPVAQVVTAATMASWGWLGAQFSANAGAGLLRLRSMQGALVGEHDILLDYERSPSPYQQLDIKAELKGENSSLLIVAEVDDPRRKHTWALVEVSAGKRVGSQVQLRNAVDFRAPSKKNYPDQWPSLHVRYVPGPDGDLSLNGPQLFHDSGLKFRRWSHMRFVGAVDVENIMLSQPVMLEGMRRAGLPAKRDAARHAIQ